MSDTVNPELIEALKTQKEEMNALYAHLIATPYNSTPQVNEMQRLVIKTATSLMEHGIPLTLPPKERSMSDVIMQAAGEVGMMAGSTAMAQGISFVRQVKDNVQRTRDMKEAGIPTDSELVDEEVIDIYQDEEGLFFIDDEGTLVPCDEFGNPLED